MMSREPLSLTFKVTGMDCAACARKIETAVRRIQGASDVKVGLATETLTLKLADARRSADVDAAIKGLGYGISTSMASAEHFEDHDDDNDHAKPIEGKWWQSPKGRLVLASGVLIATAYVASRLTPGIAFYVFLAACIIGAIPVIRRAAAAEASARSSRLKCS